MKGREVFRHAVVNLADVLPSAVGCGPGCRRHRLGRAAPGQCRILDATARKLGLPPEKVIVTVDRHANTSAASVPLALDVAVRDGRIKRGDLWCLRRWVVALPGVRLRSAIEAKENLAKLNCGRGALR